MAQTPTISTHVLDTGLGCPAKGVPVTLYHVSDGCAAHVGSAVTDDDGRVRALLEGALHAGVYRIVFDLAAYRAGAFFTGFATEFEVRDTSRSYHVPLILSPHSGMTYLGS
jgi:hydroxyisourate hydrolase